MKKKRRNQPARRAPGSYSHRERVIYPYWDGTREVAADPIRIQREFSQFPDFDLVRDTELVKLSEESMKNPKVAAEASAAMSRMLKAIRHAFHLEDYQYLGQGKAKGLTDAECILLIDDFGKYVGDLKKKAGISPTSPKPMESAPSAKDSVTANGAASGGTATESAPSEALPSQPA